ncbi:EAL domain-containing response regulator [Ideonella oryzae]|uniref:EAL domain-containing response regulator n=1 Tax=Ideonella oryzae TaxID=2937441 RepID=A0ABT1BNY8_9BURK|nr:EAL domain-containing response regulator [Ideonella oryzae]
MATLSPQHETGPAPGGYRSALVVDDSPVQRSHAVGLCRDLGIELIYEACNGLEALELLALLVLPPSLLLVDLEMPGMDGIEFIEQLHRRSVSFPVLIVSSREQVLLDSVRRLGLELGLPMVASLRKPLSVDRLRETLEGTLPAHSLPPARLQPSVTASDLDAALRSGVLQVHYQPKVDIRSGLLRGVEALARWTHPALGPIPPDQFIPLAEREGLIAPLTITVTEQALAQAAAWRAHGLNISMAVNLSPHLLECPDLVEQITDRVAIHGLEHHQVVMEITEGSLSARLGTALTRLTRLRLRGFGLSIDDYGTGFSSMQQLARIPFTELKIDRSFVCGAQQQPHLQVILRSALEMCQELGLTSVAEGIETLEDWRLLQSLGCDVGQGWLIGRPMPGDALYAWVRQHRERLPELRGPQPGEAPDAAASH